MIKRAIINCIQQLLKQDPNIDLKPAPGTTWKNGHLDLFSKLCTKVHTNVLVTYQQLNLMKTLVTHLIDSHIVIIKVFCVSVKLPTEFFIAGITMMYIYYFSPKYLHQSPLTTDIRLVFVSLIDILRYGN